MRIQIRIYYEDTDCGGVVYYANYLRYFERGRTELLREKGVSLGDLHASGVIFVVRSVEARYIAPARYDDLLILDTRLTGMTGATITFEHILLKQDKTLVEGSVTLASVGNDGKPIRLPEELRRVFAV